MESSAGLALPDLRTVGAHLGTAEDIQNMLARWDGLRGLEVVLHSDKQAAALGSHSQKALLPWLAEQQWEWGRGWS